MGIFKKNTEHKILGISKYGVEYIIQTTIDGVPYSQRQTMYTIVSKLEDSCYMVNLEDIQFDNNDQLSKCADFMRRIYYMYDHILLDRSDKGKLPTIVNHKDIIRQFEYIKKALLEDYTGRQVESYLEELSLHVQNETELLKVLSQEQMLGIIMKPAFDGLPKETDERFQTEADLTLLDDGTLFEYFVEFEEQTEHVNQRVMLNIYLLKTNLTNK